MIVMFIYGEEIYTMKEFLEACSSGLFTDWDGYGYAFTPGKLDRRTIHPSTINECHMEYTYVEWFNK